MKNNQNNNTVSIILVVTVFAQAILFVTARHLESVRQAYREGAIKQCIQTFGCDADKVRAKFYKEDHE